MTMRVMDHPPSTDPCDRSLAPDDGGSRSQDSVTVTPDTSPSDGRKQSIESNDFDFSNQNNAYICMLHIFSH